MDPEVADGGGEATARAGSTRAAAVPPRYAAQWPKAPAHGTAPALTSGRRESVPIDAPLVENGRRAAANARSSAPARKGAAGRLPRLAAVAASNARYRPLTSRQARRCLRRRAARRTGRDRALQSQRARHGATVACKMPPISRRVARPRRRWAPTGAARPCRAPEPRPRWKSLRKTLATPARAQYTASKRRHVPAGLAEVGRGSTPSCPACGAGAAGSRATLASKREHRRRSARGPGAWAVGGAAVHAGYRVPDGRDGSGTAKASPRVGPAGQVARCGSSSAARRHRAELDAHRQTGHPERAWLLSESWQAWNAPTTRS